MAASVIYTQCVYFSLHLHWRHCLPANGRLLLILICGSFIAFSFKKLQIRSRISSHTIITLPRQGFCASICFPLRHCPFCDCFFFTGDTQAWTGSSCVNPNRGFSHYRYLVGPLLPRLQFSPHSLVVTMSRTAQLRGPLQR